MSTKEITRSYFKRKEDPFSYVEKEVNLTIWYAGAPLRYRILARLLTALAKRLGQEKDERTPDCVHLNVVYGGVLRQ